MNILKFTLEGGFVGFLARLYRSVARVYDIIIEFSNGDDLIGTTCTKIGESIECSSPISDIITTLYTLIGIFMLFRVMVSFLNYLIDPDKLSDKQVGGGKLLTRIVVSLVLFLSLNSVIFPFLYKVQSALLDSNGILNNIFVTKKYDEALFALADDVNAAELNLSEWVKNNPNADDNTIKNLIIPKLMNYVGENSEAAGVGSVADINKYFYPCDSNNSGNLCYNYIVIEDSVSSCPDGSDSCITSVTVEMKNEFQTAHCRNYNCQFENRLFYDASSSPWPYYKYRKTSAVSWNEANIELFYNGEVAASFDITVKRIVSEPTKKQRVCYYTYYGEVQLQNAYGTDSARLMNVPVPVKVVYSNNTDGTLSGIRKNRTNNSDSTDWYITSSPAIKTVGKVNYYFGGSNGALKTLQNTNECPYSIENVKCQFTENIASIEGDAWNDPQVLDKVLSSMVCTSTADINISNSKLGNNKSGLINGNTNKQEAMNATFDSMANDPSNQLKLPEEFQYSNGISSQALEFSISILNSFVEPDEQKLDTTFLSDANQTKVTANKVEDGVLSIDIFLAMIISLALIFFLFAICLEVVVRNLKLMFLEIISPIAVISYMNPSDKIFNSWVKQYTATFAALFIQLFVLRAGIFFIDIFKTNLSGFSLILLYAGAFMFIKIAPKMISSIFNIDAMGGTFKESVGLAKAGLFGAIGGAIGAGAATATGIKAWHASRGQGFGNRFAAAGSALATGLSSTARGMGSGFSGKLGNTLAGAKYASQTNAKRAGLYEAGYGAGNVMLSGLTRGLYDPNKKDEQIEAAYDDVLAKRKAMDDRINDEVALKGKGGYRITGQTGDAAIANGLSIQQLDDVIKFNKFNGRELTGNETSALKAIRGDQMDAAAAHYMKQVAADNTMDEDLARAMRQYDATVDRYSRTLGKKDAPSDDTEYTYDFTSFVSTKDIVNASGSAVAVGKVYKNTKKLAQDSKNRFSGSDTRRNHIKMSKDK